MISFDIWSGQATSKHVFVFLSDQYVQRESYHFVHNNKNMVFVAWLIKTLYAMNSLIKSPQLIFKNMMFVVVYI